ncbi:MAG: MarR family transcriptional regulator [Chloroflexi bacterium]|nr:MarR family transcriptional regulator [Chloroflexota bacterium]
MIKEKHPNENTDYRKYVPFMNREYNLLMLAGLTVNAILKARQNQVKELGLTTSQFHLLMLASELGEEAFPAEIARWMMLKPPTVSSLCNRMERDGLIVRRSYKNNKKLKRITITKKGEEALVHLSNEKDILTTIMNSLSQEEYQQLWILLEKLKGVALSLAGESDDVQIENILV